MLIVNNEQYNALDAFFNYCWNAYHKDGAKDFAFWADQLDALNIAWHVQNHIAVCAEKKSNMEYYVSTLLKQINIVRG